jgi:hypothetical protein
LSENGFLGAEKTMSTTLQTRNAPSLGYFPGAETVSPLVLADKLLSLAQDADRAGYARPAERLLRLAYAICNERPH